MERLTMALNDGTFYIADLSKVKLDENGYFGEAVGKLARFENIHADLIAQQDRISAELDKLRQEDKTHTTKFKQLLANKLMNSNILILFKTYGL